jgi:Anti-anti-sigma regulatory factor (antagonist of anti-sigma factor)
MAASRDEGATVQYRKENERHFTRLILTGRFTGQDMDVVRRVIAAVKEDSGRHCLLDLSGLEFMDSAAIGMLLVLNGEAASAGKHLGMLAGNGQVLRLVEQTRIAMIIPVFETVDDYIAVSVPEAAMATAHPCAPGEDPLAVAARALNRPAGP